MNWCSPYSQNTTISFQHVDSWAKSLHFRTHHLQNSTTELTLTYNSYFQSSDLFAFFILPQRDHFTAKQKQNSLVSDKVLQQPLEENLELAQLYCHSFSFSDSVFQIIVFLKCNPEILGLKHTSLPNIFLHIAWLLL